MKRIFALVLMLALFITPAAMASDSKAVTIGGRSYFDILDEDTMSSDSAYGIPTQQSVKAYVDTRVIYVPCEIPDVSTSQSAWTIAPVAGTISSIYTVIDTEVIVASAGVTLELGGTLVTGSEVTIASGSAAGTVDSATPTATNTVTAGQAIEVITNGASQTRGGGASIGRVLIGITQSN